MTKLHQIQHHHRHIRRLAAGRSQSVRMQRRRRNRLYLAPVGQLPYARPAEDRQLYQHRPARCTAAARTGRPGLGRSGIAKARLHEYEPRRQRADTYRPPAANRRCRPAQAFGQQRPPHHFGTRTGQRTAGFGIRAKRTECRPRAEKPKPRQPAHGQHPRPPSKYPGPSARIEPDVGMPNAENPETRCRFQDFCFHTAFSDGLLHRTSRLKDAIPQIPVSRALTPVH